MSSPSLAPSEPAGNGGLCWVPNIRWPQWYAPHGGRCASRGRADADRLTSIATLQARIDRLALEGQYSENAFMDATQGLTPHKSLERLDSECELPERQGTFRSQAA